MSGICGRCRAGAAWGRSHVESMLSAITRRGDGAPRVISAPSIIYAAITQLGLEDVSAVGDVSVALDADICNLAELRAGLESHVQNAADCSAAEVVAHLYRLHGLDFVKSLLGSFVIAVWDAKLNRLALIQDRLGINALYWAAKNGEIWFSSRVGAVAMGFPETPSVDPAALLDFLNFSAVAAPRSIYQGIQRLEPGTMLVFERETASVRRYWDLEYPESKNRSTKYWAEALRDNMRSAVHRHLAGCERDRTGAYLSGGTDSSSVVAFMSEQHSPTNSFSIFFEDPRYSEIDFARTSAKAFGTRHFERSIDAKDAFPVVESIVREFEEPFGNSSAVGGYFCALMAREAGMDVLLAGDGGDELFGGNERYATDKRFAVYHNIPGVIRHGVIEPAVSMLPLSGGIWAAPRKYVRRANVKNPRRILWSGYFLQHSPTEVFDQGVLDAVPPERWLQAPERHFAAASARSELNRILYMDVKMTLADNDLRKVVGTARMAGIKVRFPLLDHQLAEFSGRIPTDLKLKGFEKRYLFKKAMTGILPERVIHKKKHGFGVPLGKWFFEDAQFRTLVRDVLLDQRTRERGYFAPRFVESLLDDGNRAHASYFGEILWYLLVFELWHRRHYDHRLAAMQSVSKG